MIIKIENTKTCNRYTVPAADNKWINEKRNEKRRIWVLLTETFEGLKALYVNPYSSEVKKANKSLT